MRELFLYCINSPYLLMFIYLKGQWMTEKAGGSDVRQTETVANLIEGNVYVII
jgi:hypothetical protein